MSNAIQVLHVDDEPSYGDLVATFLEKESDRIAVISETSAEDGLETLEEEDVECVVSDYDMPRRNGLEFLEGVRKRNPDIPFILFTGKGSEEIASEAISAGVTDYMQKEGGTDQYTVLANRVRNAVRQYRSKKQAEQTQRRLEEVTQSSTDCIWMFNRDWDELLFISGYEEVWDRPVEAIKENPQDFLQGVHPDDREFVREAMEKLSAGDSIDIEYRIQKGEGEMGWVWVKGEPVFNDDGTVVRVVGFTRDATDRKIRERELQEEREFIDQAINTLDDVFYVIDTEGALQRWNDAMKTTLGYDEEEITDIDVTDLFPKDHRDRISDAIEETIETGEVTVEADFQTTQGERIPHEFTGARLTDPDGTLVGLVGVGRDISERKERERELRRNERRFEAMFHDPNILVGLLETDGTVLNINDTALEYISTDREELQGTSFSETPWFTGDEAVQQEVGQWIERARDGEYVNFEANLTEAVGEPLIVSGVFRPVVDDTDNVVSLLISDRDVTDQKVKEKQLAAILENTTIPMFLKNRDGEYLLVNQGFIELFGLEEETVVGKTDDELFPAEMAEDVKKNDTAVLEQGEPIETEEKIVVNGSDRVYLSSKVPVYDIGIESDPEDPVAVFGVANDITARKQREQELERQNEQFDELASIISHDLQTPIETVRGRLELATEADDPGQIDEAFNALERVDDLRGDIVNMLRSREIVGETESVEVAEAAESAWESVTVQCDATLETVDSTKIEADPDALGRLLQNLLSNSVEHGSEEISIRVGKTEDGFYLEDNGPGIPEKHREDVLTPGFTTKSGGNGMGMASVRQIVDAHGWQINITEAETLDGVRFEITRIEID
jgi:PAS domain S-box-containing protein